MTVWTRHAYVGSDGPPRQTTWSNCRPLGLIVATAVASGVLSGVSSAATLDRASGAPGLIGPGE